MMLALTYPHIFVMIKMLRDWIFNGRFFLKMEVKEMKKFLLFGGSGRLGKEVIKQCSGVYAPSRSECDITKLSSVQEIMHSLREEVDIVIHAAALVGTRECERNKDLAWLTNVMGTSNIAKCCRNIGKRLVFISSNLIFDGEKGNYKESDTPNPKCFYGVTKIAAEQWVNMAQNYCIIRLDFFPLNGLKYDQVYTDHYTSKIPANEAAEKILKLASSDYVGTINIGQPRRSLFEILRPYYLHIKPITIRESIIPDFPRDLSLNLEEWEKHFA